MNIDRKPEREVGAVERAFDVAQRCVEPEPVASFGGGAPACGIDFVWVARREDGAEATQPVAVDLRVQGLMRHVASAFSAKPDTAAVTAHCVWPAWESDDERSFVIRAVPGFATVRRVAKMHSVKGREAVESASRLTSDHAFHGRVLDMPDREVVHAQMPRQQSF